jgi:NAD(P)-dependent dehydrogenase (short-subunit alcohol dehydrogenase family)
MVLTCRELRRGEVARDAIRQGALQLDLADQQSIRTAAHDFKSPYDQLDVLINNAAIYTAEIGAPRKYSIARSIMSIKISD